MEPEVVRVERRGRKRKRKDGETSDKSRKKTAAETRSKVMIGRYVRKEFDGNGVFLGKIVSYDSGLYRVDYEDGDCEDLDSIELKAYLIEEKDMDSKFNRKKKTLDDRISKKYAKLAANKVETVRSDGIGVELANAEKAESLIRGGAFEVSGAQDEVDAESVSDLSDYDLSGDPVEVEESPPLGPPPELPVSSGNFGVSEEHVSYLLSVYSFLRSYSVCLFLSPFGLDEFVGALNSSVPNTLLDAIHVALIRALKSHVETLSSEGSELASKCLRCMDWSLLDSLTWPVFIVQYLMTMKYAEGPEWKAFYVSALEKDYYTLSAGRKLIILQLLCDDALCSAELRAEIDMREATEVGPDPDVVNAFADVVTPRKPHSGSSKNSLSETPASNSLSYTGADVDEDGNVDECRLCGMDGTLLCCDGCPSAYHTRCIGVSKMCIPEGAWYCPECAISRSGPNVTRVTTLKGAAFFGIDPYEQVFIGSCDHLLVIKASESSELYIRYYSPLDIQKVLLALTSSTEHRTLYLEICKGILQYWEIPEHLINLSDSFGKDNNTPDVIDSGNVTVNGVTELTNRKDVIESAKPISENNNSDKKKDMNTSFNVLNMFYPDKYVYTGSSFKPQSYTNVYIHGDYAASAAARLAILSSEEKIPSQTQPSSSHRKFMSANYSLQNKAFSLAAKRFYWPDYERKLVEVSRERCGWCLSCKASVSSRKGCLLNGAASNAIKASAKILASLRHSKNSEGSLASIATYVMYMEECLCGLTVGPFLNFAYRNQWQKRVEEAATLGEIKAFLLEFESNIRDIAFSADWIKLVDDLGFENQVNQTATGPAQKRGPGRRGRKPAVVVPEITDADGKDLPTHFAWWRGGMLSKHIFQKGILPQTMIKNAARKGGCGKIDGVQYVDGSEVPKRSRQFLWRAAVEMSKTASQLALQVRYLDLHMRWNELIRPEQPLSDAKASDSEASAFRNASIVDKKVSGNKISYGVVFENQKHLPSRVLKHSLEVEKTGDYKDKYWFVEMRIPLYLIKEYEKEMMKKIILPNAVNNHVSVIPKLQKKQLKASGKNIFSFLSQKKDNMGKCLCTLCQLDVPFRIAAKCSACQGYCHLQCSIRSNIQMGQRFEFKITCKRCYQEKELAAQKEKIVGDSPTSPLPLQGPQRQQPTTIIKIKRPNGNGNQFEYLNQSSETNSKTNISGKQNGKSDQSSKKQSTTNNGSSVVKKKSKSKTNLSFGLIWKTKNPSDNGIEFRLKNLLLKNNPHGNHIAPVCHLCTKPYNSELMYIRCFKCDSWYHADSVELKESKIMELLGFKCCRCRRIRIPFCPYMDPETRKKLEAKKNSVIRNKKKDNLETDSNMGSAMDWGGDSNSAFETEDGVDAQEEDDLNAYSFPTVDQVNTPNFEMDLKPEIGSVSLPRKLPVRRHTKSDNLGFDLPETSAPIPGAESSNPTVEWDVSTNGFEDNMMFDYGDLNYEDMEFEPQTYFSFNELLASDDAGPPPAVEPTLAEGQYQMGITYDETEEPMFSVESSDIVACNVCTEVDPAPNLYCKTCGMWIHQNCSPWDDEASWEAEDGWKCGHCREWR